MVRELKLNNEIERILIIENAKSGQGRSRLKEFKLLLISEGFNLTIRQLNYETDISDLLNDYDKFDLIIAAGGDGTVCCISHQLKYRNKPVLIYPAGTANLIAQNLGLRDSPSELLDIIHHKKLISLDIGSLHSNQDSSGFIVAAGAGIDAEMIRESEKLKKDLGSLAYLIGILKQSRYEQVKVRLELDGRSVETEAASVLVANLGMINYRIPIAEGIDPSDGLLNVILIKGQSPFSLLPNILDSIKQKLGLGDPMFQDRLEIYNCRKLRIFTEPPLSVQYDGELLEGTTPLEMQIHPRAINFFANKFDIST